MHCATYCQHCMVISLSHSHFEIFNINIAFTLAPSSGLAWHASWNRARKPCWPVFTLYYVSYYVYLAVLFLCDKDGIELHRSFLSVSTLQLFLNVLLFPHFDRFIRLFVCPRSYLLQSA